MAHEVWTIWSLKCKIDQSSAIPKTINLKTKWIDQEQTKK